MANYYASARSNYFGVKDPDKFREEFKDVNVDIIENQNGNLGLLSMEECGWPMVDYNEETGDYVDIDLFGDVAKHLKDGHVAVFMEIGAEKLRYLVGYALAINNKNEIKTVNISDIYHEAHGLGNMVTKAEY